MVVMFICIHMSLYIVIDFQAGLKLKEGKTPMSMFLVSFH